MTGTKVAAALLKASLEQLHLPPSLHKCLGTTDVIESPQSGVQKEPTTSPAGAMVERWAASAWLLTEKTSLRWSAIEISGLFPSLGREHIPNASSEKIA
jgi:hypothetical protein